MAESELYQKGAALRRQLLGDAAVERSAREIYSDPVMKKFIDMATETVFGALFDNLDFVVEFYTHDDLGQLVMTAQAMPARLG